MGSVTTMATVICTDRAVCLIDRLAIEPLSWVVRTSAASDWASC